MSKAGINTIFTISLLVLGGIFVHADDLKPDTIAILDENLTEAISNKDRPLEPEYQVAIESLITAFKNNDRTKISEMVIYPLNRQYPIPPVKSKKDLIERFDEIFDDEIISIIANSDVAEDWEKVGWRGIMLNNGKIWAGFNGKIIAVNYESNTETQHRSHLIELLKSSLHESLQSFAQPILQWKTESYIVRVDLLNDGNYRFASWENNISPNEQPDLILSNGVVEYQGSAGNHSYIFNNGSYQYTCSVNVMGKTDAAGFLLLNRAGQNLIDEVVVEAY